MRLFCDYKEMKTLGISLGEELNNLETLKNKTLNDIEKIRDYYTGEDVEVIIGKYKERVNRIDNILLNLTNYKNYFNKISDNVEENDTKSLQRLKEAQNDFSELKVGDPDVRLEP